MRNDFYNDPNDANRDDIPDRRYEGGKEWEENRREFSHGRGNRQNRRKPTEPVRFKNREPKQNAYHWVPYLLIGLAIFLGICAFLNLFCNWGNRLAEHPSDHWMGSIGYYICYGMFGMFGTAAFLLPVLLGVLGFFWKSYLKDRVAAEKSIAAGLLLLSFSSWLQVFQTLIFSSGGTPSAKELINVGAKMRGGGFLGGEIGFFFIRYFSNVGAIITTSFLLILLAFFFLGMTPSHLFAYLRTRKSLRVDRRSIPNTSDVEKAWKEMSRRHAIAKDPSLSAESTAPGLPPADAIRPVKKRTFADPQKNAEELAPMPMPTLNASGEKEGLPEETSKELFIPEENNDTFFEDVPAAPAEKSPIKEEPTQLRDPSIFGGRTWEDPSVGQIFPKAEEERTLHHTQKSDKGFELKNIFIELDDLGDDEKKTEHTELPPEVPMQGEWKREKVSEEDEEEFLFSQTDTYDTSASAETLKESFVENPFSPRVTPKAEEPKKENAGISDPMQKPEVKKTEIQRPVTQKAEPRKVEDSASERPETERPVAKPSNRKYQAPPMEFLHPGVPVTEENRAEVQENINKLQTVLNDFHIGVSNISYSYGPALTRYEVFPAPGVRVRSIVNLSDDIALSFARAGVRMEAPIPGMSAVGVEVPNDKRCTVYLRQLLESEDFRRSSSKLTAGLGVDVTGKPILFDISKMPHLLVAGATGMGKSVCINCVILSLLYHAGPEEVKLIMIDPKKVEFSLYKGIPHLLAPIITSPKDATGALQAAVEEMERRFELIEEVGVHNLAEYNEITKKDPDMPFLPQIVIIIDELADLMMTARDEVETAICRLAQKARAAGMHIIVGTQRPSVDVVTGLIKSNIPSRIACTVASQVDSRTILDVGGAEKLIGKGDMLFAPVGCMKPSRVQGAFVSSEEVEKICNFVREENGTAIYDENFTKKMKEFSAMCGKKGKDAAVTGLPDGALSGDEDTKYMEALQVALEENRVATSLLQRKLGIGYSRAAKLIDRMEEEGFVSKSDGTNKPRSVLITREQFMELFMKEGFSGEEAEDGGDGQEE